MANKNVVIKGLIEGVLTDLMIKTVGDQVYLDESTTLTAKLAEILADVALKANKTDVTQEIKTAIDGLIGGAPGTYDTLKEIADYIAAHENIVTALNEAIGNKADKAEFEVVKATVEGLGALSKKDKVAEADLDAALAEKINNASAGNHSHANKAVLDGIQASDVTNWNGKSKVYIQAEQPESLAEGDLWLQVNA